MKIILDENMPRGLLRVLAPHQATSAQQAGFAGMKNGRLLTAIENVYEALLTADKNLRYQQNLAGRQLAIIELPTNRWPDVLRFVPQVIQTVNRCQPGSYTIISAA